ncbi:group III truncated hemoglobin [Cycloclasticus pugetii]|uniref:group III truncated hemoglobin n=1 Tax=Cycloclasticus pugetii TaxID=34068 RepID=UPI00240970DF|nr:group III truncated hemoglobin [Cycloclasticus pugetii]MDF1829453.1 group III truncated hemoglobin [Cycloclasticus pugetii]
MNDSSENKESDKRAGEINADRAYRELHLTLGKETIQQVVSSFYDLIKVHPTLGGYFSEVKDWDELKQRIDHFWWIDLGGKRYREDIYNPHAVHRYLKIPPSLVDDWVALFSRNLYEHLPKKYADIWLVRATKMAEWIRTDLQQHQES